jgi:hypothetical protein
MLLLGHDRSVATEERATVPEEALLRVEPWQKTAIAPISPAELDRLIVAEQQRSAAAEKRAAASTAALTTDEQFLRRLCLDLHGRLPTVAEIEALEADSTPDRRARWIERLLDSDDFARHWGGYLTDLLSSRVSIYMRRLAPVLEEWLTDQLRRNRGWGDIVRELLTAEAVLVDTAKRPADVPRFVPQPRHGAAFFIATRYYEKTRAEGAVDLAAETARIFLGIRLQCAQCHDHPFDQWRREQFHQFAGFFARSGGRPRGEKNPGALGTYALVYYPDGEYEMPDAEAASQSRPIQAAFLDGRGPASGADDAARRGALARFITDKNNYWFAAAFVNRIWGELLGQAFYQPVDDLGPQRDAVQRDVLTRLTGAFRASAYDIKALFRTVLNTEAYQRQSRVPVPPQQHLEFAASCPTQLRSRVLARVLLDALSPAERKVNPKDPGADKRFVDEVRAAFDADPSTAPEPALSQILLLMNGPSIHYRLAANGPVLGGLLKSQGDDEAVRLLYLRTLGRRPSERESAACRQHLRQASRRAEAYEDIWWALLNAPEFITRR